MPINTDEVVMPSMEELEVKEINVSSPILRASGVYLGKYCDEQCKEYMLCKKEEKDPRFCLNEGKTVTACGYQFFQKMKSSCRAEVEAYSKCLEWNSPSMEFRYCRKAQSLFDQCMKEKMNMERPPFGYFSQVRVHQTSRPKPPNFTPKFEQAPGLPEDYPRPPPVRTSYFV